MKPFESLTSRSQINRLRRLAASALENYDFGPSNLTLVRHRENTTFRIDHRGHSPSNVKKSTTCGIRISRPRPGVKDPAFIQSELIWLSAIRKDTSLLVPEPIAARNRRLLTIATAEGIPEPRVCVVFRWIEGRFISQHRISAASLERVGAFMGRLHQHNFKIPDHFIRPRWNMDGIHGGIMGGSVQALKSVLSDQHQVVVDQAVSKVSETIESLGENSDTFGLIHADFHQNNYLFQNETVAGIDFEIGGWGYYLYDMGTTLGPLTSRSDFPALRTAFLKGYQSIRPLSNQDRVNLNTFLIANRLHTAIWMASLDNPALRDQTADFAAQRMDQIKLLQE